MDTNRRPEDGTHTSFWQAHSRCILVAAAVVLVAAAAAFTEGTTVTRPDIIEALNRLSSCVYIMFCKKVSGKYD